MSEVNLSRIERMIYVIRGQKVMLDSDLAELYGVETRRLNEQVKRNSDRFPDDFMYQITQEEFNNLRVKRGELSDEYGGKRKLPNVFTENGVAMLSSVLHSQEAVQVNIAIMRIFTKLRSFLMLEEKLSSRMDKLEIGTNKMFRVVFERLDDIEETLEPRLPVKRKKIGLKSISG